MKRFKHPISTREGVLILKIHKYTLWNWGKLGKIRMIRDNGTGPRIFDRDELKALAPRLKERMRGMSIFPSKK